MYREKVNPKKDKKVFSATADKTHKKNFKTVSVNKRGGIRL